MNKCRVCWHYVCICGRPPKKKPLAIAKDIYRGPRCSCGNILTIGDRYNKCKQCVLERR